MDPKNYYGLLGVDKSASQEEITRRFHELIKKNHPDINSEVSDEKTKQLITAFKVLTNPTTRRDYDSTGEVSESTQFSMSPQDIADILKQDPGNYDDIDGVIYNDNRNISREKREKVLGAALKLSKIMFWTGITIAGIYDICIGISKAGDYVDTLKEKLIPKKTFSEEFKSIQYRLYPHTKPIAETNVVTLRYKNKKTGKSSVVRRTNVNVISRPSMEEEYSAITNTFRIIDNCSAKNGSTDIRYLRQSVDEYLDKKK